ncbi:MAG: prolipoprotein diacylglyceryl transferase [Polyangiales bacterium]
MIPYIAQPSLAVGPLTLHAFGLLVAIAVMLGSEIAKRRARTQGLSAEVLGGFLGWVVVAGFVGGHVLDLLFYEPAKVLRDPIQLLRLWDGLGSFGGFVGAILGAFAFVWRRRVARPWAYVDAIAYSFPFGWIFGRLGCTLAFDHPGKPTHFFFGEKYVDGIVRHNLGLEEAVYTMVIAAVFYVLARKSRPEGFFVAALAIAYAPVRFALDTLRIGDTRYGGLTPGQYGSIALFFIGLALLSGARRRDRDRVVRAAVPAA